MMLSRTFWNEFDDRHHVSVGDLINDTSHARTVRKYGFGNNLAFSHARFVNIGKFPHLLRKRRARHRNAGGDCGVQIVLKERIETLESLRFEDSTLLHHKQLFGVRPEILLRGIEL